MKKFLSLCLAFVLIIGLVGCKPNNDEQQENNSNNTAQTNAFKNLQEIFKGQELITVAGKESDENHHIVTIGENGTFTRYATIKGLKKGKKVNIMQSSDFHFNKLNQKDLDENIPLVMDTYEKRTGFRDESSVPAVLAALSHAKNFDALAITGDNIDYLTWGSLELLKQHVFDAFPSALVAIGGHDTTRAMGGSTHYSEPDTIADRYAICQQYWPHDIDYTSKIIEDRVMMIQIDNGRSQYFKGQYEKLEADIQKARQENLTILIFQHEPICTYNRDNVGVYPIVIGDGKGEHFNFYSSCVGNKRDSEETLKVHKLISSSADVIKGIFCGHLHANYYTEVSATYEQNGETVNTFIPQYVLSTSAYNKGMIFAITVE